MRIPPAPFASIAIFALAMVLSSCISRENPRKGTPATAGEVNALLSESRDPRRLFITVYRSKDGPVFADATRPHPGQQEEFDLARVNGSSAPVFTIMDESKDPVPFLIDPRSKHSWIDFQTAMRLRIRAIGPDPYSAYIDHIADPTEGFIGVAENLSFSRMLSLESVIINVRPYIESLGPLNRGWSKPEPLCLLGLETLRAFKAIQLDFPAGKVRFSVDGGYKPSPDLLVAALPARIGKLGLEVDGILDGYKGPVHFDLAGRFAVAAPNPARARMQQVTLGDFAARDVAVLDADDLGLQTGGLPSVGYDLFKELIVTLDNERGRIVLELPPPSP